MPSYPSTEKKNKTIDVHKLHYYVRIMDQIKCWDEHFFFFTYVYSYYSCEKIIVVLSRDFSQNEQCMYLLRVAISKSPGTS